MTFIIELQLENSDDDDDDIVDVPGNKSGKTKKLKLKSMILSYFFVTQNKVKNFV